MQLHNYKELNQNKKRFLINFNENDSQNEIINTMRDIIIKVMENFQNGQYEKFCENVSNLCEYFNALYENSIEMEAVYRYLYDENFNMILMNSFNLEIIDSALISDILSLISFLSDYQKNFHFFSSLNNINLFNIAMNFLKNGDKIIVPKCIGILIKYIVVFQTSEFPYNLLELISLLFNTYKTLGDSVSNIAKFVKLMIKYIDTTNYITQLLNVLNLILNNTLSVKSIIDSLNSLIYLINSDIYFFPKIFNSGVIQNLMERLEFNFLINFDTYKKCIKKFFNFLLISFNLIDDQWQKKLMKLLNTYKQKNNTYGIFNLLKDINDSEITPILYNILYNFLTSTEFEIQSNMPLFNEILNSNLLIYLIKSFHEKNFSEKKQIIFLIDKLLQTENQELFNQLLLYDDNFINKCYDFVLDSNETQIQISFLKSLISLCNIGEKNGEFDKLINSIDIDDLIDVGLSSDDATFNQLVYIYCNITAKE